MIATALKPLPFILLAALAAALAAPESALAHVAGIEYRFPLPVWLYAAAGALAVLASGPAAALAVRSPRVPTASIALPSALLLALAFIGRALATALFAVMLIGGFFSDELGFFNPAPVIFWVDLWVGLGITSALVGNLWDFVSPLSAAGRLLERTLARRGVPARPYPTWLGVWPAVGLLLLLSWAELVWDGGRRPVVVASLALVYVAGQLVAMAVFGAEVWLARGELFTVVARTFGRLAPLELFVKEPGRVCRAERCDEASERIGCPACWLDAPSESRGLRLRRYGSGILREPALGAGGAAFVVMLLATVVYDGARGTSTYQRFEAWLIDLVPGFERSPDVLGTYTMAIVLAAFALLFVTIAAVVSLLEPGRIGDAASRYAPTLIPIAAVYFIAHYFLYLFYVGQLTPGVVLDPLGKEWFHDYRPWTGVPAGLVWLVQAGLIVWGHIVAVIQAHRVSLRVHRAPKTALLTQLPLLLLMVAYTFTGLWVLGQALSGEG